MTSKLIESLARAGFMMLPLATVNEFRDSVPTFYRSDAGVDWFVEGDLIEEDGISELSIRIVDPRTDLVVWAQPFREGGRPMSDFMLDVAQLTADSLAVRMGLEASRIRVPRLTSDPIADSLYSRARYLVETNNSLPGARQSAFLFAGAIERDSAFAPAYVGLAMALQAMGRQYWDPPPAAQALEVGRLLQRAIELDPTYAETHAALGWYAYTYEWDWEAAERHYRQALELAPDLAVTYTMYAFLVLATGRTEEGLRLSRHATELAPLNPRLVTTYCWHLYLANRFEDVADACQRVITQLDPNKRVAIGAQLVASVFGASGEQRADIAGTMLLTIPNSNVNYEIGNATWMAIAGDTAGALALLEQEKIDAKVRPFRIANGYAWAGELDSAFVWLDRAIEARDPLIPEVAIRPVMEPYRGDPRYQDVLRRLNLADPGLSLSD
jgi:tetratricopeptide (TPR) repeat protein